VVVGEYRRCTACGRVLWLRKPDDVGARDLFDDTADVAAEERAR
jgi:hypothetical protein